MSQPDIDPYEPVVIMGWRISRCDHEGEPVWSLETEGTTLHGQHFTARRHYEGIEEIFDVIREAAL